MPRAARCPLVNLLVTLVFLLQSAGLAGCGDVEKAYKQATGQTVVDDALVREKLAVVNERGDNVASAFILMIDAAEAAQAKGDGGDAWGMATVWVEQVGPAADRLLATMTGAGSGAWAGRGARWSFTLTRQ